MTNWKKNIAFYLIGQNISLFGSSLVMYAVQWYITLNTQSGIAMTLFTIAHTIPMFLVSPFAGVWADRYDKKLLITISDAAIAFITLLMAVLFQLGYEYTALLMVCIAVRGAGQGIQMPTVNSLLPEIVPEEQLLRINSINASIQSAAMFLAPMLSGALISILSIQSILFVDVVTACIGISFLLFFVKTRKKEKSLERKSSWGDIVSGIQYVNNHAFIKQFIIISILFNILITPAMILTPLQTVRDFGEEPWRLVSIELAFFIGMSLGGGAMGVWGGFKNKSYSMAFATALAGISIVILGIADIFPVYLLCMSFAGFSMSMFSAPMMTLMQLKIEPEYMGRVFSVMAMISSLAMPAGMLMWGPLADIWAIDNLLMISGTGILLLGSVFILNPTLREAGR